jgi:hypothetical protein
MMRRANKRDCYQCPNNEEPTGVPVSTPKQVSLSVVARAAPCVCAPLVGRRSDLRTLSCPLSTLHNPLLDSYSTPLAVAARPLKSLLDLGARGRGGGRPRVAYPHTLHLTTHRALLPRSIHGETSIESQDRMYIPIENMTRLKPGHANTVKRILGWANVQRATARTEHARCVSCHGLLGYRSAAARRLSTRAYATDAADPLPTPRPFSAGRARYLSSFSDYVGEESSETEAQGQRRARRDPRSCSALTAVR